MKDKVLTGHGVDVLAGAVHGDVVADVDVVDAVGRQVAVGRVVPDEQRHGRGRLEHIAQLGLPDHRLELMGSWGQGQL